MSLIWFAGIVGRNWTTLLDGVMTILKKLLLSLTFALFATQTPAMFIQPDWLDPTEPGVGTNRYAYSNNDPINNVDPNGNFWGIVGKVAKAIFKGGDLAATTAGIVEDWRTLTSSDSTGAEKLGALVSLGTEIASPVSIRDAKHIGKKISKNSKTDTNGSIVADTSGSAKTVTRGKRAFKEGELEEHYEKHGQGLKNALGRDKYTKEDYLDDANHTIEKGKYVPEINAYVKLVGGKGQAKYAVAGLDRNTGNLTTFI